MENHSYGNDNIKTSVIRFLPSAKKYDWQKLSAKKHAPSKHSLTRLLIFLASFGEYATRFGEEIHFRRFKSCKALPLIVYYADYFLLHKLRYSITSCGWGYITTC